VEWLEISNFSGTAVEGISIGVTGPNSLAQNLLIHDFSGAKHAVVVYPVATLRNSIIYNGPEGVRITNGSADATLDNMTIWNVTDDCVDVDSGNALTLRNCILLEAGGVDLELDGTINYLGYTMYETWSGQDPETFDGFNQTPPADLDDLFVSITATSENLHLESSGHNALDTGSDLSTEFTIDIDGATRSGSWDIGADEVGAAPVLLSSGSDQTFTVGDSATLISPITVTDAEETPTITAADDIRISIPSGFNMVWDVIDTAATVSGGASGKVSNTVSYENGGATLLVDVTTDFAAADTFTISDLNFKSFSAASSTSNLELDINNNAIADATDDKTIKINAAAPPSGTALLAWTELEPVENADPYPLSGISFDDITTNVSSSARSDVSFSHTVGDCDCCADPVIVVISVTRGDQGTASVSYGGQGLALAIEERAGTGSGDVWTSIWYLAEPPTGTNTVSVTFNNSKDPSAVVVLSYFGVDPNDPIGATASDGQVDKYSTVGVDINTTVDDSYVVGGFGHKGGDTDPHSPSGDVTTEHFDVASGSDTGDDDSYCGGEIVTTTSGTYRFEFTNSEADDYAICCVELKPSS
jgi:hypothetical protein